MLYIILMCISHSMYFSNDLLLAVYIYFIFILDYGNDVWQKANSSSFFFLFELKIDPKAAETTHNINGRFSSGIANEYKAQ